MLSKFICFINQGKSAYITDNIQYRAKKFQQIPTNRVMTVILSGDNIGFIKSTINLNSFLEVAYSERAYTFAGLAKHPTKEKKKIIFLQKGSDIIHNFDTSQIERNIYTNTFKIIGGDLVYLKNSQKLSVVKNLKFDELDQHRNFQIQINSGKIKDFLILKKSRIFVAYLGKKVNKSDSYVGYSLFSSTGKFLTGLETQHKMVNSVVSSPDGNFVISVVKSTKSAFSLVLLRVKGDQILTQDTFYLSNFTYMQHGAVVDFGYGVDSRYLITVYPQVGKKGKKSNFCLLCLTLFNGKFELVEAVETEYRKYMVNCLGNGRNEAIGIANKNLIFVKYSFFEGN